MKIKAVLFDMDGVLVDNDLYEVENERYIFKTYSKFNKVSIEEAKKKWLEYLDLRRHTKEWYDWRLACKYLGNWAEKIWIEAHIRNLKYLKLIPGARELIEALADKYTIAVASDTIKEVIDIKLGHFGLLHYFDHFFSQDSFKAIKKEDAYFNGILKTLGMQKGEVVFIDDRAHPLKTATQLGIKTILVPYDYKLHSQMRNLIKTDAITDFSFKVEKLSEIPKILANLERVIEK